MLIFPGTRIGRRVAPIGGAKSGAPRPSGTQITSVSNFLSESRQRVR